MYSYPNLIWKPKEEGKTIGKFMPLEKREEVAREIKSKHFVLGSESSNSSNLRSSPIVSQRFLLTAQCQLWSLSVKTTGHQKLKI